MECKPIYQLAKNTSRSNGASGSYALLPAIKPKVVGGVKIDVRTQLVLNVIIRRRMKTIQSVLNLNFRSRKALLENGWKEYLQFDNAGYVYEKDGVIFRVKKQTPEFAVSDRLVARLQIRLSQHELESIGDSSLVQTIPTGESFLNLTLTDGEACPWQNGNPLIHQELSLNNLQQWLDNYQPELVS